MENLFMEVAKASPLLALMLILWFFQRQDYKNFVDKVQSDNLEREKKYQDTITENQGIIFKLSENFNVVKDMKDDIKDIKDKIFK
ncbi:MAG: hypothetical protein ABF633_01790 [Clostridium sp.]|uniref:hypothetical protein n=1 Tax=Clostridium sp. TaxID=1506 RepID=UPI0039ECD6B6